MSEPLARALFVAEPPARYLLPTPIVVDCSVLAGVLFQESWYETALRKIEARALHAPALLPFEVASVARKKYRQGHADWVEAGLTQLDDMAIELHDVPPAPLLALALRYGLSTYDAAYLWVAAHLKAPLVTFDEKLAAAAKSHLASLS